MVGIVPQKKTGSDLLEEAISMDSFDDVDESVNNVRTQETPFNQAFSALTQTGGNILQMMARMTPELAIALERSYLRYCKYQSDYISGRSNLLLRISVSNGGEGRKEMIEAVKAGAGVPGEYYNDPEFGGATRAMSTFEKIPQTIDDDESDSF